MLSATNGAQENLLDAWSRGLGPRPALEVKTGAITLGNEAESLIMFQQTDFGIASCSSLAITPVLQYAVSDD